MTYDWIESVSLADTNEISGAYRLIARELGLQILPPEPNDFIPVLASAVDASRDVERVAENIVARSGEMGISVGKHPAGFAAAALYAASIQTDIEADQQTFADAAEVSTVTISRQWNTIQDKLELDKLVAE